MAEKIERAPDHNSEEEQKSYISHFVGHLLLIAGSVTARGRSAEEFKTEAIKGLMSKTGGSLVDEVIDMIGRQDLSTSQGIENFKEEYNRFKIRIR